MSGRTRDPNDDIKELKQKVRTKEIKIAELEQRLQRDRVCYTKNTKEFEDEKKALEKEVDELKKKIKWLEEEVRYFSTKPAITSLRGEIEKKDAQIVSFEHKLDAIINQLAEKDKKAQKYMAETDELKKDLNTYMAETDELKKSRNRMEEDIKYFTKMSREKEEDLNRYMAKTDKLEKSRNKLYIGQLCANVMEAIYWEVLPEYFDEGKDYEQPHLRYIDAKIKQLCKTRDDQKEAQSSHTGNVRILEVNPDGNYVRLFNTSAHRDEEIGGYMVQQNVSGRPVTVFRFPPRTRLKALSHTTVWSAGSLMKHNPPSDFLWKEQHKWGTGPECTTILCKPNGQAVAWTTAAFPFGVPNQIPTRDTGPGSPRDTGLDREPSREPKSPRYVYTPISKT